MALLDDINRARGTLNQRVSDGIQKFGPRYTFDNANRADENPNASWDERWMASDARRLGQLDLLSNAISDANWTKRLDETAAQRTKTGNAQADAGLRTADDQRKVAGATSGTAGGSGGSGGACPAPDVPLEMADGTEKPAGEIRVGDMVAAWDEHAGCKAIEAVTHVSMDENDRWWLHLTNGQAGRFAKNHRFLMLSGEWVELQHLSAGDWLFGGVHVVSAEPEARGPVVKITVNRVHTYITLGVVSHNVKVMPDIP